MIVGSAEVRLTTDGTGLPKSIKQDLEGTRDVFEEQGSARGTDFGDAFTRDASGRIRDSKGRFASALDISDEIAAVGKSAGDEFTKGFSDSVGDSFSEEGSARGKDFGDAFTRDANLRLRDSKGRFFADLGLKDAASAVGSSAGQEFGDAFTRDANGRLRDSTGRFVNDGASAGDSFTKGFLSRLGGGNGKGLFGDLFDRDKGSASALTGVVAALGGAVTSVGLGLVTWGPAILIAGAAVTALLPALAVGVPAILGIAAAAGVIALSGSQLLKAIQPLSHGVAELKSAVGGALTAGFTGEIRELAHDLLPILKVGLVGLATVLNQAITPLIKFADSSAGLGLIRDLFTGMTNALRPLFDLLTPITKILLDLGVAASPGLLVLTQAIAGVVENFAAFLDKGVQTGTLFHGISGAVAALLAVFSGLGDVLSPLLGLFVRFGPAVLTGLGAVLSGIGAALDLVVRGVDAASSAIRAGDSVIQPIIDGAKAFAASVGPELVPTFEALRDFVAGLVPIVAGVLGPELRILGQIIGEEVLPAFQVVIPIVGAAIAALAAGIAYVVSTVQGTSDLLGPLIEGIKGFASAIGPQLAPTFAAVQHFAAALLPTLIEIGQKIVDVVGPALTSIGQVIAEDLLPSIQALLPVLEPVAKFLLTVIGDALVGALKGAVKIIEGVLKIISGIFDVFAGIFTGDWGRVWEGIKLIFGGAFQAILGAVEVFINVGILKGFKIGLDLLKGLWKEGIGLLPKILSLALDAVKATVELDLKIMVAVFTKLPGRILSALGDLGRLLVGRGGDLIEGLKTGALKGLVAFLKFEESIPGKVLDVFKGAGRLLFSAGRAIVQGLLDGAAQLLPSVGSFFASQLPGALQGPFKKALGISSPSKVFAEHGKAIVEGLIKGIQDDSKSAEAAIEKLANQVAGKYKAASDRLATLQDQRAQFATTLRDSAISGADPFTGDNVTADSILSAVRQQILDVNKFAAGLAKLKAEGLSKDLYAQLANLGVDQGLAAVTALASTDKGTITLLDQMEAALVTKSTALGKTTAGSLYDAGVKAAQGLVDGLKSMEQALIDVASDMGTAIVKKIKDELKIKSPSQVFADIGKEIPAGLALGIDAGRSVVSEASSRMATASLITPNLGQLDQLAQAQARASLQTVLPAGAQQAGSRNYYYTIDATNMTPAELQQELEDAQRLDAALHSGGL